LAWRTLRTRIVTGNYITSQRFFRAAREDALTPYKAMLAVAAAQQADPQTQALQARAEHGRTNQYPQNSLIDWHTL
jgi:hypothetical protein